MNIQHYLQIIQFQDLVDYCLDRYHYLMNHSIKKKSKNQILKQCTFVFFTCSSRGFAGVINRPRIDVSIEIPG